MYCKKFQIKLGFKSIDYKIRSIERTGIKVCNYLSGYFDIKFGPHPFYTFGRECGNKYDYNFKKDSLKNLFVYHLERLKIKFIKDYLIYYFKKYKEDIFYQLKNILVIYSLFLLICNLLNITI